MGAVCARAAAPDAPSGAGAAGRSSSSVVAGVVHPLSMQHKRYSSRSGGSASSLAFPSSSRTIGVTLEFQSFNEPAMQTSCAVACVSQSEERARRVTASAAYSVLFFAFIGQSDLVLVLPFPAGAGDAWELECRHAPPSTVGAAGSYYFSMPLVRPLPGLVAQQKPESSPHAVQLCLSSVVAPFPTPLIVQVPPQPAHA